MVPCSCKSCNVAVQVNLEEIVEEQKNAIGSVQAAVKEALSKPQEASGSSEAGSNEAGSSKRKTKGAAEAEAKPAKKVKMLAVLEDFSDSGSDSE